MRFLNEHREIAIAFFKAGEARLEMPCFKGAWIFLCVRAVFSAVQCDCECAVLGVVLHAFFGNLSKGVPRAFFGAVFFGFARFCRRRGTGSAIFLFARVKKT